MRDDFRWLRRFRHLIYVILWGQTRFFIRFMNAVPERVATESSTLTPDSILIVYRDFGNSNVPPLNNLVQNLQNVFKTATVTKRVRIGNTLFGNARWLRQQYHEVRPSVVVVCDPQLFGLPGLIGLVSLWRLVREFQYDSVALRLILFDLPDPQGALFAAYLLRKRFSVGLMCSTINEGDELLRQSGSKGPLLLATAPPIPSDGSYSIFERDTRVFLPKPSYEPRAQFVSELSKALSNRKITFRIGGEFPEYQDLQKQLNRTQVAVVTNAIITGASGSWPLPLQITHHLTYGNLEALSAGCLLLTEDCDAVRSVFTPGYNCLTFKGVEDALNKISWVIENQAVADRIASNGRRLLTDTYPAVVSVLDDSIVSAFNDESTQSTDD